ncbi:MAG: hypothetical protein K2X82_10005 [Gemmataceae bacterium]|nr:hypothetical protein [Gemmataceae bacterium]
MGDRPGVGQEVGQVGPGRPGDDAGGRLANLQHRNGAGTVLANYTYAYDAADRLTSKAENGAATTYAYDPAGQVTQAGAAAFAYDPAGNRKDGGYASTTGNRMTNDGVWTYSYDAAGRVSKRSKGAAAETWVYDYDHDGRLLTAKKSATDGGAATARGSPPRAACVPRAVGDPTRASRTAWGRAGPRTSARLGSRPGSAPSHASGCERPAPRPPPGSPSTPPHW